MQNTDVWFLPLTLNFEGGAIAEETHQYKQKTKLIMAGLDRVNVHSHVFCVADHQAYLAEKTKTNDRAIGIDRLGRRAGPDGAEPSQAARSPSDAKRPPR